MKSEHRARADFLRELRLFTRELYEFGDFTCTDPDRALLEAKLNGFIEAGLLIDVVSRDDMQKVIDECHVAIFSETRTERRNRINSAKGLSSVDAGDDEALTNWDVYDSPAFDRAKGSKNGGL